MEIKNALITGAASGMGKITAKRLAADGVHVAAVDVPGGGCASRTPQSSPAIAMRSRMRCTASCGRL